MGVGAQATYSCSHLCPQYIVLLVIPHGNDIVTAGVEADGIIEVTLLVLGANRPHALHYLGIICHERVGSDTSDMS